jgi:hypothetical protein
MRSAAYPVLQSATRVKNMFDAPKLLEESEFTFMIQRWTISRSQPFDRLSSECRIETQDLSHQVQKTMSMTDEN